MEEFRLGVFKRTEGFYSAKSLKLSVNIWHFSSLGKFQRHMKGLCPPQPLAVEMARRHPCGAGCSSLGSASLQSGLVMG